MSNKGFTYTLQIDAEISDLVAKAAQVKKSMQSIMDSGKATGTDKIFNTLERALDKLQQKASQPITSIADFNSIQKDASAVALQLTKLGNVIQNLGDLSETEKLELLPADFQKRLSEAQKAIANFAVAFDKASTESKEFKQAQKDLAKAQEDLAKANNKVAGAQAQVDANKEAVKQAKDRAKAIKDQVEALKKYKETYEAYEKTGADKRVSGGHANNSGISEVKGKNLPADRAAVKSLGIDVDIKSMDAVEAKIAELSSEYDNANKAITAANNAVIKSETSLRTLTTNADTAGKRVSSLEETVDQLNKEFEENKAKDVQAAYAQLRAEASKLGANLEGLPLEYTEENLLEVTNALMQLRQQGLDTANATLETTSQKMEELGGSADLLGDKMNVVGQEVVELDKTVANTTAFTQRIAQFVGLQGGIELARRAMRDAMSTIKDLDAAMTEMAVVTDLGVGDYWSQLPEYTKRANELGVSIKSAYESATLYYQQGLKTNEVVAMSNQTLKMARIAGLSAEDATNKMTAALRGFNMELNETSAQKVADVYSELAAITASDVNEISSAMTKTASIAASAGMQFETTAAFLSQIIETTRESAETAGTALKTVIARFQELKKDPSEIGEVDGEVIDANKIETALRSVGVALRDTSGQFRDLDEVFLELSSKWDSLDTNTQRYIATIAAGSRQQSRFIAMMSDYARTQDLVTAANNSAGASNKQFEKTMDSLESKLNELKNAWDSFTMGIMNSTVLKAGVDILTALISSFNKFSELFGNFSGAAKIGLLIMALKLGENALGVFNASLQKGNSIFKSFGAIGSSALNRIKADFLFLRKMVSKKKDNAVWIYYYSASQAAEEYKQATEKATRAQQLKQTVDQSSQKDAQQLALAEKMSVEAKEEQTKAVAAYSAAQGVSAAVAKEAMMLQMLGVGAEEAEKAALGGLTAAKYKDFQATMIANGLSPETIAAKMAEIVAIYAKTGAQETENAIEKKGLALIWSRIVAGAAKIKSLLVQTAVTWGLVPAETAATVSGGKLALVALAIVAAIAILVVLVIGLIHAFKQLAKNSPEGKLKAAQEASEAASEAADAATESYNKLNDSLNSLDDKYKNLEDLTKGTREWRDAVREINDEVLNLMSEYPELAGIFENKEGVLVVKKGKEEELEQVLRTEEIKAASAQSAEIASKIAVLEAEERVEYSNLSRKAQKGLKKSGRGLITTGTIVAAGAGAAGGAYGGGLVGSSFGPVGTVVGAVGGGIIGGMAGGIGAHAGLKAAYKVNNEENEKNTRILAQALAKGDIDNPNDLDSIKKYMAEEMGLDPELANAWADKIKDNIEELTEFGRSLNRSNEQAKMYHEAIAQNAAQLVDTSGMTEEQQKQINVAASAAYGEVFVDLAKTELDEKKNKEQKADLKDYAESLGWKNVNVNRNKVTYTDANGDSQEIDREEFEKQYAAAKGTEAAVKALEKLPAAIEKVAEKNGAAFANAYMAKEGSALTKQQAEQLNNYTDAQLETLYNSLEQEEKEAFGSLKAFQAHIRESEDLANQAFDDAKEKINGVVELNGKLTADSAKGYANQLELITAAANEEGATTVDSALDAIGEKMSESDFNKFMGQINAMDWKNMDDWENLPELLKTIGLEVPNDELETFIKEASSAAGAIKKIDFEKLREKLLGLESMKSKLKSGEQGRVFSEADYKMLVEADKNLVSQFQQNLDGDYVYLGSSMATLTQAIEANTAALLGESTKQLQNKVDAAEVLEKIKFSNGDITDWKDQTDAVRAEFLKTFIDQATKIDLKQLGIEGLSNNTRIGNLNEEQIDNMLEGLVTILASKKDNLEAISSGLISSLTLNYMNENIATNSDKATDYRAKLSAGNQLTEREQAELTARTNAITTQAVSAGVNTTDIRNYTAAIESLKKLQEQFEKNGMKADAFATQYSKISKEAEKFERKIVNKTNLAKLNQKLASSVEQLGDLSEQFDNTADEATKMEVAAKMVEGFGVQVDETNYEHVANLAKTVAEGGEAGFTAMQELLNIASIQYGLRLEDMNALTSTAMEDMSEEVLAFAKLMETLGMGMFQEMENGLTHFVWATQENLDTAIGPKEQKEAWESPYDYLYAKNEETNRLIREREKMERRYQRAVSDSSKKVEDLLTITEEELAALKEQANLQGAIALKAQESIKTAFADNEGFAEFVAYDTKTNTIRIDTQGLANAGWDEDTGSRFEEFLASIEENRDVILEAQDTLNDIEDQVEEIENRGREEASSLYDAIKEGIIAERQEEIDKLSEINDSINDAQSKLVDQIQKQIDEERQARQNEETEQNIADKAARLAYLKRDTSGANATAIRALEKELRQDKQAYSDTLIDQKLQQIQNANEKASEQRQQQIELMQAQLDAYSISEQVWQDVEVIIKESLAQANASDDFTKTFLNNTLAGYYGKIGASFDQLNPIAQKIWAEGFGEDGKIAGLYLGNKSLADLIGGEGGVKAAISEAQKSINALAKNVETLGNTNIDGGVKAITTAINNLPDKIADAIKGKGDGTNDKQEAIIKGFEENVFYGTLRPAAQKERTGEELKQWYTRNIAQAMEDPDLPFHEYYKILSKKFSLDAFISEYRLLRDGSLHFASGGLADFTGPAWLDGTKSKPEMVLNAQDTQNFIVLRDVLQDILAENDGTKGTSGDNYFDIAINVDNISDDYSVEQLADKIRTMLYEDATYRNVNAVTLIR